MSGVRYIDDGQGCVEGILDYDDESDLIGPPSCPACAGPGVFLGSLGRREHYRCRDCGLDFSSGGR